ncbi:diguanylate cyclase domain-containing protein [Chitinibacter sp. S2-10]|uniref:diguanylate cyclase domain-containing protein n=1 Tax=Chitinibacter sp. S2-10 TaxID=3373597 RepID=UPI0039779C1E
MSLDAYILIIDDQMTNIEALGELLTDQYDVHFALSGAAALQQIAQHKPDLILLDIMMPDMDGYAVCRELQSQPDTAEIPVIFITALGMPDEESRGLDAGAVDYIVKPFNPTVVRARVRNHLAFKQAQDQLRLLAQTDGLTGLANRRYLFQRLQAEFERAQHTPNVFSLILIDVDYFKRYNDTQGHVAGDVCLQRIAGVIMSELRNSNDLMARYGGEEFCCLLPDTHLQEARLIAERIARSVTELAIPNPKAPGLNIVTISAGVAQWQSDVTQPETLLQRADQGLYAAKDAGRNQVCVGYVCGS